MERLTHKDSKGWYIHDQSIAYDECRRGEEIDLLAAYEDTGLMPEEITDFRETYRIMSAHFANYKAAEITGQLFVLPCRVTDTVYVVETMFEGKKAVGEQVVSAKIDHVTIGGTTGKPVFDLCTETDGWHYSMEPGQFYLTKEAAEAALKEQGDKP